MLYHKSVAVPPAEPSTASAATAPPPSVGARMDRLPITPTHRKLTGVVGIGLLFDTFENNLSGTVSQVLQADFALNGTSLKLMLASVFIGQFFGSLLLGRIADRFGRRRAFMINLAMYSVFSLLGAFSPNAAWLIVTRFFAGVGIGAEQALSDCYLSDVLPARRRGRYIAWAYTIAFCGVPAVGFAALLLVPMSPLGIDGWRWLFIVGSLGSAVVWLLRRRLVESPRWLAEVGREEEAEALVSKLEAEARAEGAVLEPPAPEPAPMPRARMRDLFGERFRRRTIMLWVFCSLSVVGYYGFGVLAPQILAAKGYDLVSGLGYTALSFLGYPIGSLLSVPVMDRVERKLLIAGSAAAMSLAGIGFAVADSAALVVCFGFGFTLISNVFSTVSHVYLAEQYPTRIRATASGAAYSLSKLSAAVLPFALLPVLDSHGPGWLFTVIAGSMALLVLTVLALGDRTTGRALDHY
ncbi:MFS transporter [Streptomyces jumonjinensis]|uniref:MFS transporter n=2 Tax=Streptomyces jumonjinensis TaxID=1945 RepID=A0A646KJN3_STRJU|nr:MFS transporter [Streptomyces jumonjinensis]